MTNNPRVLIVFQVLRITHENVENTTTTSRAKRSSFFIVRARRNIVRIPNNPKIVDPIRHTISMSKVVVCSRPERKMGSPEGYEYGYHPKYEIGLSTHVAALFFVITFARIAIPQVSPPCW